MNDCCTVAKTEFIRTINGASGFTMLVDGLLNPGDSTFFPWLSGVAPNWERYRFNELVFTYKSTSSDSIGGSNPQIGTVNMVFNGDSEDVAPPTYQVFKNYAGNRSCRVSDHMVFPIRGASNNQNGWLYVAGQPQIDDLSDYYLGRLNLAVTGAQTTGIIGELYVSYSVTFAKSKLTTGIGAQLAFFEQATTESRLAADGNYTCSNVTYQKTNAGITFNPTTDVFTMPPGSDNAYLVQVNISGAAGTAGTWAQPTITLTNGTTYAALPQNTQLATTWFNPPTAVTGTACLSGFAAFAFKATDPALPVTFTITSAGVPLTGVINSRVTISEVNPFISLP